jgi:dihydroorotase
MPDILLRGGRVIDPARNLDVSADLLVRDGKIAGLEPGLAASLK